MSVARTKAAYARSLRERITLRRYIAGATGPNRPYFEAEGVRARTIGDQSSELVGAISQGERKIILYADDLIAKGFTLPVLKTDVAYVRGKPLTIEGADDSTIREDGVLIAVILQVKG